MKEITLVNGGMALVDDEDFPSLSRHQWIRHLDGYAIRQVIEMRQGSGRYRDRRIHRIVRMHREIMRPPMGMEIDHRDGNRLNNTRANLRIATSSQNKMNRGTRSDNTSGRTGVYWESRSRRWVACIKINNRRRVLGRFSDKAAAIEARSRAEMELFGEYRRNVLQWRVSTECC